MTIIESEPKLSVAFKVPVSNPVYGKRHSLQVAALCWRRNRKGRIRILLITSRETRRWVIPKGWPMHNRTSAGAAEREAFEEAGVRGSVIDKCIGLYTYEKVLGRKKTIPLVVQVFPLEVESILKKYPENGQRRGQWFSRSKAARKVREPDLKALIRTFDPDNQ